jgi:proline iminopeptidase
MRDTFYPAIEPFASGHLQLDALHKMYFEQCGRPDGVPVVFLHGGPGAGASPVHRQFFDPDFYRIVIFDQRGCGRSTPSAEVGDNSTAHLVNDIEGLREHLGIARWIVFGGSWGSTLALAYAEAHPSRVRALVLRGIFLGRPSEVDWFLFGMQKVFPEAGQKFRDVLPAEEQHDLLKHYYRRLTHPDPSIHLPVARAWSGYEAACSTLLPTTGAVAGYSSERVALSLARIEAHYFVHQFFLAENALLDNIGRIRHLPGFIVQGRYDIVCPPTTAFDLAQAWPEAQFEVVPDAGHSAFEPGTRARLIAAMELLKVRL